MNSQILKFVQEDHHISSQLYTNYYLVVGKRTLLCSVCQHVTEINSYCIVLFWFVG